MIILHQKILETHQLIFNYVMYVMTHKPDLYNFTDQKKTAKKVTKN